MLKHNLTEDDVAPKTEEDVHYIVLRNKKYNLYQDWKCSLFNVVCKNFRCKTLYIKREARLIHPVLFGLEDDVEVAKQVFEYLIDRGIKESTSLYNYTRRQNEKLIKLFYQNKIHSLEGVVSEKYVKDSFLHGYVSGVKEGFDLALTKEEKEQYALVCQVPAVVEQASEKYDSVTLNTINCFNANNIHFKSFLDGVDEGLKASRHQEQQELTHSMTM